MGSNMAEAHPVGFQWVMEAKARGAKVIHIDPRFTRTSAVADRHVPLRAGSDIAFLGGVINYILSNELDFREYVTAYTNAAFLVSEDYQDTEDLDGLFSGYDADIGVLRPGDLAVRGHRDRRRRRGEATTPRSSRARMQHGLRAGRRSRAPPDDIPADPTLQHPRCVYQILKRHYARYTPEMVERVCGVPQEQFLRVARGAGRRTPAGSAPRRWSTASAGPSTASARSSSAPARSSSCCWATSAGPAAGSSRCAGTPASRAPPTSRRCSTCCPATCRCRSAGARRDLADYLDAIRSRNQKGFWRNADAYMVSLLKEYWGERGHRGQRLLLRLPAADQRRPRHLPHGHGHGRRQGLRLLPARPEPGRRVGARAAAAARHGQPGLAGGARPRR